MKRLALVFAACGSSQPAGSATTTPAPVPVAARPVDAPPPSQDEILAAIQKAMNDLATPAHGCWAAAATERFDVEGELVMHVDVGAAGGAKVFAGKDKTNSKRLGTCMVALLTSYKWAPPLANQSIELPFAFSAPNGQAVIDRRLVEWHGQDKVSIAVLLDENNTGNAGVSMFEVAIGAGGSTGPRVADRAELWYLLGAADVGAKGGGRERAAQGDMIYVPKGAVREIFAAGADVHAVLVVTPGGREGVARAGALPTREAAAAEPGARILSARNAQTFGPATIFLDDSVEHGTPLAASILQLPGGAKVAEHVHAHETEALYVLSGGGTMTVAGTDVPVIDTSVVQIPPDTKHAFAASEPVRALQIYTPAGPEQRFKKPAQGPK